MNSYTIAPVIYTGTISDELLNSVAVEPPVLLITSPSVSVIPSVQQCIRQLGVHGDVIVFDGMKPDVPFSSLDEVIASCRGTKIKTIIAVGGGSVIDASKAVAMSLSTGRSFRDFYNSKEQMPVRDNMLIAVPTTAGTGAELSYGAILFDTVNRQKGGMRGKELQPDIVFLDFSLYSGASSRLIAEVGFDCLTHAVETYISTASSPLVRYQSIAAIRTVFRNLEEAAAHDPGALRNMAIASSLMGVNLALSSTCLPHRIQYIIGPETNTSHAQGLIALYKGWLAVISEYSGPFNLLCEELELSPEQFIEKVNGLKNRLNIHYSLTEFGLTESQIESVAVRVTGNLINDPYYKDLSTLHSILKRSL